MGGQSQSSTTQNSTTAPWQAAQPLLTGILSQLGSYAPQASVTGAQNNALNTIESNANNTAAYTPAINNLTASLLAGGGALAQAPQIQQGYNQFVQNTSPLANNTNYDPMSTPGIGAQLQGVNDAITRHQMLDMIVAASRSGRKQVR